MLFFAANTHAGELSSLRAQQRMSLKTKALTTGSQTFRLLVIPVDFTDTRLADNWNTTALSHQLAGGDESVETYFDVASNGILELQTILAPLVHLPDERRAYSSVARTRVLATEALEATRLVLPLHIADSDQDGEVDGVLVLHSGIGLENDLDEGLIIPLQYWLEDPVVDHGVVARSYAVASLGSGLGVWLHETGHLLGLEDRYDLHLGAGGFDGIATGRGGLGRFSLMASGHLGRGDGSGASLLDAYSRIELGWASTRPKPLSGDHIRLTGHILRIDCPDTDGKEYFLCETRTETGHPYDAEVPADRLLIYHVDENVPEDGQSTFDPETRHLRVRLVEADLDDSVARGLDQGDVMDLFPTDGTMQSWTAIGYEMELGVSLDFIRPEDTGVEFQYHDLSGSWLTELRFSVADSDTTLSFSMTTSDPTINNAVVRLVITDESGRWDTDGLVELVMSDGALRPITLPVWHPSLALTHGTSTTIRMELLEPDIRDLGAAVWVWGGETPTFADWPQGWTIPTLEAGSTVWLDWSDASFSPTGGPMLACLEALEIPDDWPDVQLTNNADVSMTSPPISGHLGFTFLHAVDVPPDEGAFQGDGARVEAIDPTGLSHILEPAGSYPHRVAAASTSPLANEYVFGGTGSLDGAQRPHWRLERFAAPGIMSDYRIRFRLATDALWRGRGWLLADLMQSTDPDPLPFQPVLSDGTWTWSPHPYPEAPSEIQLSADGGVTWTTVAHASAVSITDSDLMRHMSTLALTRAKFRALVEFGDAMLQTRSVDIRKTSTKPLDLLVWPNPAAAGARLTVTVSKSAQQGLLAVHDLRGRRVRSWTLGAGQQIVHWDGRDHDARSLPAGRYFFRLTVGATTSIRSVTLLP